MFEEFRALSSGNVLRVGYYNELAVSEATQTTTNEVLSSPEDTSSTLDDFLEVGKGWLDILCGIEGQAL